MKSLLPLVDISRSRRSRVFPPSEQLWRPDLERLKGMIEYHTRHLMESANQDAQGPGNLGGGMQPHGAKDSDPRPTLSLAVFGPAGSGKSSFLKTLAEDLNHSDIGAKALDVLQPARFLEGDHFLYSFLAAALEAHRQNRERLQASFDEADLLTPVQKAFQDLSEDLRVVDKPLQDREEDPLGVTIEKLQRHASGLRLKRKMSVFIERLADDLAGTQHSVVILPVDDLDMAPDHLLAALRSLQAYLTHPRLVPTFTFTDRMAEEILRHKFHESIGEVDQATSRRLDISEQLAVQYLAKCFPIRSRLRLGPAPAALQRADYLRTSRSKGVPTGKGRAGREPVLCLLTTASYLLFGHPDRSARHRARAALHPSTLRRQFHVIDSMQQSEIEDLIDTYFMQLAGISKSDSSEKKRAPQKYWINYFNRATWSLLNVHRDVLREYDLWVEDLYSWTPRALRRVLLEALFTQDRQAQLGLFQRWRSLTDSRRSQVISLLAVNAFRPWIEGEEPSGDDQSALLAARKIEEFSKNEGNTGDDPAKRTDGLLDQSRKHWSIRAPSGLLWFTNLALGFYLPQSLTWHRLLKKNTADDVRRLSGSGWTLHNAPVHAALASHNDRNILPTGMMFLNPFSYAIALTTLPRIEACRTLDEQDTHGISSEDRALKDKINRIKIALLSTRTKELADEKKVGDLATALGLDPDDKLLEACLKECRKAAVKEVCGFERILETSRHKDYLNRSGKSRKLENIKDQLTKRKYSQVRKDISALLDSDLKKGELRKAPAH